MGDKKGGKYKATYLWRNIADVNMEEPPSPEMFAERNARISVDKSLTAYLMGDPYPGYSALDRR